MCHNVICNIIDYLNPCHLSCYHGKGGETGPESSSMSPSPLEVDDEEEDNRSGVQTMLIIMTGVLLSIISTLIISKCCFFRRYLKFKRCLHKPPYWDYLHVLNCPAIMMILKTNKSIKKMNNNNEISFLYVHVPTFSV